MLRNRFAIGKKLEGYVREIYESCANPNKSAKCICFDDPHDLECDCPHMRDIRLQIAEIRRSLKSDAIN